MTGSHFFRGAIVAACAAALAVVPSVGAVAATGDAPAAPASTSTPGIPTSMTALRAPAPPPTTHPTEPPGYVSPSAGSGLHAAEVVGGAPADAAAPASARTWGDTTSATSTLVLYDTTGTVGWLGELYAMAAGNLASHFGSVTAEPVGDYKSGQINSYTATIYLGSTYDEPLTSTFLNDARSTTHQVMWVGDNIWELSGTGSAATAFQTKYGWDGSTSFFDDVDAVTQVKYNGQVLTRNADSGTIIAPHVTGQVTVLGSAQCGTVAVPVACAPIAQTAPGVTTFPWAIKSSNLTYIGEIPLSYISEQDRYLAFSDMMFGLLAPTTPVAHQALVRLEDVSPGLDTPAQLMADADYLFSAHVPFSVGVIPAYTDPLGAETGTPTSYDISDTTNPTVAAFNAALQYMVSKGGTIIEHGYTHQYSNVPNPLDAETGDDFEFYRSQCATTQDPPYTYQYPCADTDWVIQEGPLPGDSATFASSRLAAGKALFASAGVPTPNIWETPHYSASAVDYAAFNTVYQTRYEREQFFGGQLTGTTTNSAHNFGQFYPYVVHDVYGATVIPEDLGNYEPTAIYNTPARPPATIVANAQAELAVRQGVASFFFHPYYDVADLQQIVTGIQALGFTFVAPSALLPTPAVTAVAPVSGPLVGGTAVTITGTGFTGATGVMFGTTPATIVSQTDKQIVATSPVGVAGKVDVTVATPGGTSSVVAGDAFTYLAPPAVTGVAPTTGPLAGATSVTITGTALTGATAVKFGTAAGTIVSNTDTQIVVTSPAGSAGTVDVTVTTPGGTSTPVVADGFTYVAAPVVTQISPTSGPASGGTEVTITGSVLAGATGVKFGSVPGTIVSNTDTQIVADSPVGTAGSVDVNVTTVGGTSSAVSGDVFTYIARPVVTQITPNGGPTVGGTPVTITGTALTGTNAVVFGTVPGTIVSVTDTQVVVNTPVNASGTVDVTVTTPGGISDPFAHEFTFIPLPLIAQIAPAKGPAAGGTAVTITGTNFDGATTVHFGSVLAHIVSNTSTKIVVVAPKALPGTVDVTVTTPVATSVLETADQYTNLGSTSTKITSSTSSVSLGKAVTFTAAVATLSGGSAPTGTVRFTDNGLTLKGCAAVALKSGKATCKVTYSTAGRGMHAIAGTYSGSSLFSGSVGRTAQAAGNGYWLVASDGGIFSFGDVTFHGSTGAIKLNRPIVGMAPTASGNGYWLVASDGGIFAFGDAKFHGSTGAIKLKSPIVAMVPTPSGKGYWMVAADGGIFAFGDAKFHGSTGAIKLSSPIVSMVASPSGKGYWMVAADGKVFAFGDAKAHGSVNPAALKNPAVGIAATPSGNGYWVVASNGSVFAFGDAKSYGSTSGIKLNHPINGMIPSLSGKGYLLVASDGGIFRFGDATFHGSTGAIKLNRPIIGGAS